MSVRDRWLGKYNVARHWAAVWRQRYLWNPTPENKRKLMEWRERVEYAKRVLARHPVAVTGVSETGLALIRQFEGFRSRPYRDAVGVWTIGYGETAGITSNTAPWTEAYARKRLAQRVDRDYLSPVLKLARAIDLDLRQHEADALASLSYNLGPGIFAKGRTMGDALRSKDRERIADAFLVYDKAGSPPRPLAGLTARRHRERTMFLS